MDHDGARLASYYVLQGELEIDGERAPTGAFVQADGPHTATGTRFLKIVTNRAPPPPPPPPPPPRGRSWRA